MGSDFKWQDVPGSTLPDSAGCALSAGVKVFAGAIGVLILVFIVLVAVSAIAESSGPVIVESVQGTAEGVDLNNPGGCVPCGAAYALPLVPLLPKGIKLTGRLVARFL